MYILIDIINAQINPDDFLDCSYFGGVFPEEELEELEEGEIPGC